MRSAEKERKDEEEEERKKEWDGVKDGEQKRTDNEALFASHEIGETRITLHDGVVVAGIRQVLRDSLVIS